MERTIGMADVVDAAVSSSSPGGAAEFDTTAVAIETRGILAESPVQAVKVDDSTSGQPEGSISELREPDWPDLQAVPRPVAAEGQELMGLPSFAGNLSWGQNIEPENSEPDDDELNSKAPSPSITKVSSKKKEKPKTTITEFEDEDEVEAIQVTVTRHPKTTAVEPATVMITKNDPPKTSRPKVQTQIAYVEDDLDDEEEIPFPKRPSKDRKKPEDDDERVCLTETFIQEIIGPSVTKTSVMELVVVQKTSTSTADTPKESKGKGKDRHRLQTSGNVGKESERSRCWASIIMASIGLFTVLVIGVGQWI
jgi:hypothetical protein